MRKLLSFLLAAACAATMITFPSFALETVDFSQLANAYPDLTFGNYSDVNIIEIDTDSLNYDTLKSAVDAAGLTEENDVVVINTDDENSVIDMGDKALSVDINEADFGKLMIVSAGTRTLTLTTDSDIAFEVVQGTLDLGGMFVKTKNRAEGSMVYSEPISLGENARVNDSMMIYAGLNLNGLYSITYRMPITESEYMYMTGLSEDRVEYICTQLNDFHIGTTLTDDFIVDAEKINQNDSLLCWAASTSNILFYTGWSTRTGLDFDSMYDYVDEETGEEFDFNGEDALFRYFAENFDDMGGDYPYGLAWFFNGIYEPQGNEGWAQVNDDSTGGSLIANNIYYLMGGCADTTEYMPYIERALASSFGVGFGVYFCSYDSEGELEDLGAHALTAWGFTYNRSLPVTDKNRYTSLIFSDSDSDIASQNISEIPNKYYRAGITWNDDFDSYTFSDDYIDSEGVYVVLSNAYALIPSSMVEQNSTVVTTDSVGINYFDGETTLDEAVENAIFYDEPVTFDQSLDGKTLYFQTEAFLGDGIELTIDASALPNGIVITNADYPMTVGSAPSITAGNITPDMSPTVYAENAQTVITIDEGASLTLKSVTIDGLCRSGIDGMGCIINMGTLTMENCSLVNGYAEYGTGLLNTGTAYLDNTEITDCIALENGGGIYNIGACYLNDCKVTHNESTIGGIYNGDADETYLEMTGNMYVDFNWTYAGPYGSIFSDIYAADATKIYIGQIDASSRLAFSALNKSSGDVIAKGLNYSDTSATISSDDDNCVIKYDESTEEFYMIEMIEIKYIVDDELIHTERVPYNSIPELLEYSKEGYTFSGWYYDNAPITGEISIYGFTTIKESSVYANIYDSTLKFGEVKLGKMKYQYGEPVEITITPKQNFSVLSVTVDGVDVTDLYADGKLTVPATGEVMNFSVNYVYNAPQPETAPDTAPETVPETVPETTGGKDLPDTGVTLFVIPAIISGTAAFMSRKKKQD